MSAIVGMIDLQHRTIPVEYSLRMMQSLERFPYDDQRVFQEKSLFFGNHAQWITPESIGEIQPYRCPKSGVVITADAIIDNRSELFNELGIDPGLRKEMTDSRLIVEAYLKWGEDLPAHLIGDFAFMIWDENKRRLFGARDFSGLRTLYYARSVERFYFGSTIASLHAIPDVPKQLNDHWLAEFLAIPEFVPAVSIGETAYQHIYQVPPAHSITVKDGNVKLTQYITLPQQKQIKFKKDEEYEEAFLEIYRRAIKDRLRTFKRVSSYLSGGLDSGSVASIAARELKIQQKKLLTFSSVPVPGFQNWIKGSRIADESEFIKHTIDFSGNMEGYFESFPDQNSFTGIDEWLDIMESPYKFFENSHWIRGINEKASSMGAGILLSGGRGNHTVSWGNALSYYADLLKKGHLIKLGMEVQHYHLMTGKGRKKIIQQIGRSAFSSQKAAPAMEVLISDSLADKTKVEETLSQYPLMRHDFIVANNHEKRQNYFRHLFYMGNAAVAGKLSLKYGIWTRDPTNDLRIINYCLSIPQNQFVKKGMDRALIRRSMQGILPDEVRLNYKVRGLQSADTSFRLQRNWPELKNELTGLSGNPILEKYIDLNKLKKIAHNLPDQPIPSLVTDYEFKVLMRSLIASRFILNH
ncbi:asparagine synthase-related protein [Jeotgalibacillus aurantiacus]|uniref:asparagine synthase-related protein n=1 Tax=Jeotgalibacillus aurantiacus TaxID=2763266 RepID=UPI001D0B146B|nr:asparagine synthase-related protein [Jeotgalibacillus aurantiacus]